MVVVRCPACLPACAAGGRGRRERGVSGLGEGGGTAPSLFRRGLRFEAFLLPGRAARLRFPIVVAQARLLVGPRRLFEIKCSSAAFNSEPQFTREVLSDKSFSLFIQKSIFVKKKKEPSGVHDICVETGLNNHQVCLLLAGSYSIRRIKIVHSIVQVIPL
jgi:hypothetical protein